MNWNWRYEPYIFEDVCEWCIQSAPSSLCTIRGKADSKVESLARLTCSRANSALFHPVEEIEKLFPTLYSASPPPTQSLCSAFSSVSWQGKLFKGGIKKKYTRMHASTPPATPSAAARTCVAQRLPMYQCVARCTFGCWNYLQLDCYKIQINSSPSQCSCFFPSLAL